MTNSVSVQRKAKKETVTERDEEEGGREGEGSQSKALMVTGVVPCGWGEVVGRGRGCGCHDTVLVFRLLFLQQLRTMLSACELFSVSISVLFFL